MRYVVVGLVCFGLGVLARGFFADDAPAPRAPRDDVRAERVETPAVDPVVFEAPRGDGVIRGVVRTEDGEPLGGVRVIVTPHREFPQYEASRAPEAPPMDKYFDGFREAHLWQRAARREARTEADGTFEVAGIGEGVHYPAAYFRGWEIKLPPGRHEVRAGDEQRAFVELDAGEWVVTARGGRRREYKSAPLNLRVRASGTPPIVLDLSGGVMLRGRVVPPEGFVVRSAYIHYKRWSAGPKPSARVVRQARTSVSTDSDLSFTIPSLKPGRYVVGVSIRHEILLMKVVDVAGITDVEFVVPPPDPAQHVVVRAFAPDGAPVREFNVMTRIRLGKRMHGGGRGDYEMTDGARVIGWPEWDEERDGRLDERARFSVDVRAAGFGTVRIEAARDTREVVARFKEPATLRVVVEGFAVHPLRDDLNVSLRDVRLWTRPEVDEGVTLFKALQPGRYVVELQRRRRMPIVERETTLESGTNQVTLPIPRLYDVAVRVEGATEGQVYLIQSERWTTSRILDGEGRATFDGIPAGRYEIYWDKRKIPIEVPTRGPVIVR